MSKESSDIRRGTSNIFADLGYSDPDTHLVKAQLIDRISIVIASKNLTQSSAAEIMSVSQPDLSRYLKGQFRDVSVERIMRMLARLGCTVDIVVKEPGRKRANSVIHVGVAAQQKK